MRTKKSGSRETPIEFDILTAGRALEYPTHKFRKLLQKRHLPCSHLTVSSHLVVVYAR
jgi:hypothetical protein